MTRYYAHWWHNIRYELSRRREHAVLRFVSWLPSWLIYRATIRAGAHATTGQYSTQVVPELSYLDALQRWHADRC